MSSVYFEVNAFTGPGLLGNPAGVCPLQAWLPDVKLQAIAEQNNLSETAFFVLIGANNFELRWFTPTSEIDLCGHATLASAHVIFNEQSLSDSEISFQTKSGTLKVSKQGRFLTLDFPVRPGAKQSWTNELALNFNQDQVVDLELSRDLLVVLESEESVRSYVPNMQNLARLPGFGCIISAPGATVDFVSRFFLPHDNIPEDPVTGSAHCHLIPYWASKLEKSQLVAHQVSSRGGELLCELKGDRVFLSGVASTYLKGEIFF
jgi:PhzF family phenazine biosynthesis protein